MYPDATELILLGDCGGSNASHYLRFKKDVIGLARRLGVRVRSVHYPPYIPKWNPIEHRLFNRVDCAWNCLILDSVAIALSYTGNIWIRTSLRASSTRSLRSVANAPTHFALSTINSFSMPARQ